MAEREMTPVTITELRRNGRIARVQTDGKRFTARRTHYRGSQGLYIFASEFSIWFPTRAEATAAARAWLAGVKG